MPEPIFQRVVDRVTPASNTSVVYELPAWPLSFLTIDIRRSQPAANTDLTLAEMLAPIQRVYVNVRGVSLWDMTGGESFTVGNILFSKNVAWRKTALEATTRHHIATIYIPFSRKPLMPNSGLKAIERGNLLLSLEFGTVPTGLDYAIHAFGWRENAPEWVVRCVRQTVTISATGDNDIILAPAGPYLGFVFWEDNPMLSSATTILNNVRFLIQGIEDTITSLNYEAIVALHALLSNANLFNTDHTHIENTAAAYAQNATTLSNQNPEPFLEYTSILLDELFDPDSIIAVPPGADARLRINSTATGELRIFPIEMFTVPEKREVGPS